jgi:hypothetical protein
MSGTKAQRTNEEKGMNIAREQSMKKFEDLYADPPPYTSSPQSSNETSSRTVTRVGNLNFQPSPLEIPTPAECIAHLKLLHAFARLRHEVGNCEGVFGISMGQVDAKGQAEVQLATSGAQQAGVAHEHDAATAGEDMHASDTDTAENAGLAERIRDKRWTVYVAKAVARFEKWWELLQGRSLWWRPIKTDDFEGEGEMYDGKFAETPADHADILVVRRFPVSADDGYVDGKQFHLPPLDVLMVWHAYMLNPRIYLEDSVRYTKQTLWRTSFPWELVHAVIDNETFEYKPGNERFFRDTTGHTWDLLHEEGRASVKCPACQVINRVPWTQPPTKPSPPALEVYLTKDNGFAGSEFEHRCWECKLTITHEKLRVGKFCDDAHSLIHSKQPMAGTILNAWGEPSGTVTYPPPFEACAEDDRNYYGQETGHARRLLPSSCHRNETRLQSPSSPYPNANAHSGHAQIDVPEPHATRSRRDTRQFAAEEADIHCKSKPYRCSQSFESLLG